MKTVSPATDKPQFELKPLSRDSVDTALEKAEHYRLLNQPRLAESICHDVLEVDPNQRVPSVLCCVTDSSGSLP